MRFSANITLWLHKRTLLSLHTVQYSLNRVTTVYCRLVIVLPTITVVTVLSFIPTVSPSSDSKLLSTSRFWHLHKYFQVVQCDKISVKRLLNEPTKLVETSSRIDETRHSFPENYAHIRWFVKVGKIGITLLVTSCRNYIRFVRLYNTCLELIVFTYNLFCIMYILYCLGSVNPIKISIK